MVSLKHWEHTSGVQQVNHQYTLLVWLFNIVFMTSHSIYFSLQAGWDRACANM